MHGGYNAAGMQRMPGMPGIPGMGGISGTGCPPKMLQHPSKKFKQGKMPMTGVEFVDFSTDATTGKSMGRHSLNELLIHALDDSNGYTMAKEKGRAGVDERKGGDSREGVKSEGGGKRHCRYRYVPRWRQSAEQAWAVNFLTVHSFGSSHGGSSYGSHGQTPLHPSVGPSGDFIFDLEAARSSFSFGSKIVSERSSESGLRLLDSMVRKLRSLPVLLGPPVPHSQPLPIAQPPAPASVAAAGTTATVDSATTTAARARARASCDWNQDEDYAWKWVDSVAASVVTPTSCSRTFLPLSSKFCSGVEGEDAAKTSGCWGDGRAVACVNVAPDLEGDVRGNHKGKWTEDGERYEEDEDEDEDEAAVGTALALAILNIWRNASFVAANEVTLASHAGLVLELVRLLHAKSAEVRLHVLDIIANIAKRVHYTGLLMSLRQLQKERQPKPKAKPKLYRTSSTGGSTGGGTGGGTGGSTPRVGVMGINPHVKPESPERSASSPRLSAIGAAAANAAASFVDPSPLQYEEASVVHSIFSLLVGRLSCLLHSSDRDITLRAAEAIGRLASASADNGSSGPSSALSTNATEHERPFVELAIAESEVAEAAEAEAEASAFDAGGDNEACGRGGSRGGGKEAEEVDATSVRLYARLVELLAPPELAFAPSKRRFAHASTASTLSLAFSVAPARATAGGEGLVGEGAEWFDHVDYDVHYKKPMQFPPRSATPTGSTSPNVSVNPSSQDWSGAREQDQSLSGKGGGGEGDVDAVGFHEYNEGYVSVIYGTDGKQEYTRKARVRQWEGSGGNDDDDDDGMVKDLAAEMYGDNNWVGLDHELRDAVLEAVYHLSDFTSSSSTHTFTRRSGSKSGSKGGGGKGGGGKVEKSSGAAAKAATGSGSMVIKELIGRQQGCFGRLVSVLRYAHLPSHLLLHLLAPPLAPPLTPPLTSSEAGRPEAGRIAAGAILNLSLAPSNHHRLLEWESDLAYIVATEEPISDVIANLMHDVFC
jgi:hypothetical protein